jgi:hypothetical protein
VSRTDLTSVGIMESATETTSVFAQALTVEDTAGLNNVLMNV